jgi:hypothetical protein
MESVSCLYSTGIILFGSKNNRDKALHIKPWHEQVPIVCLDSSYIWYQAKCFSNDFVKGYLAAQWLSCMEFTLKLIFILSKPISRNHMGGGIPVYSISPVIPNGIDKIIEFGTKSETFLQRSIHLVTRSSERGLFLLLLPSVSCLHWNNANYNRKSRQFYSVPSDWEASLFPA